MSQKKIKFDQYMVRGKHRDFHVIVLCTTRYMWAYWDDFDKQYEIDGDTEAYHLIKYALAILINDPTKIIYLPIRNQGIGEYFHNNSYDAVLTRPELQLRRSEWVNLRRQLDRAHRIENYVLRYDPDILCDAWSKYTSDEYYKMQHREKQEVNTVLGDTMFVSYLKDSYLAVHNDVVRTLEKPLNEPSEPVFGINQNHPYWGWILTPTSIKNMEREASE